LKAFGQGDGLWSSHGASGRLLTPAVCAGNIGPTFTTNKQNLTTPTRNTDEPEKKMSAAIDETLGMPPELFDIVTEMVALRETGLSEEDESNNYVDYDFAHKIARLAFAAGVEASEKP
jgi:hypothetical protein